MPLTETPPDPVQDTLRALAPDAPDVHLPETRLSLAGDIAPDGTFGERWLIVDRTHLRVLTVTHGKAHLDLELPLADIREAKADTLVGNGALFLTLKDARSVEALRYTVTHAAAFAAAARALESYLKDEEPPESLGEDLDKKHCPNCGDPLPDDTNVCGKCVDKKAVLARLLSYALPYKFKALLVVVLMLTGTAAGLVQPKFQQHLIDDVLVPHRHMGMIAVILLSLIGINLLNVGITIWRGRVVSWMSNHMVYTIRGEAYDRLQALSLGYYEKRQVGSLMARVTQDVGELQDFLVQGITFFVVNTLTIIGILTILLIDDWRLTLLVLIPIPITVLATRYIWKMMRQRFHRMWHLRSSLSASINAALSGVKVVKAFAQESREMDRFQQKSFNLFTAGVVVQQAWQTYFPLLGFLTTVGTFIIWYYGGLQVFHNGSNDPARGMTLGTLTMFLAYIGLLMGPLQQMTQIADWLSRSTAAADRVFEVIDAEPDVNDAPDAVAMPHIEGRVELHERPLLLRQKSERSGRRLHQRRAGRDDRPGRPLRRGQEHHHQPAVALLRCQGRRDSRLTAWTSGTSSRMTCAARSASSCRSRSCSPAPSPTTSPTPSPTPRLWRSCGPPRPPTRTTSSCASPTATTPGSASAARGCPAASASASPSPAPSCTTRAS